MWFETYRTFFRREYRWRLHAANGEVIASGEGYRNRGDMLAAIRLVQRSADAPIHEEA